MSHISPFKSYKTASRLGFHRRMFKLFATTVPHEREPQPLVKRLLLGSWDGGSNDARKTLEGLEKRKTPLSDHLHDVLPAWCAISFS